MSVAMVLAACGSGLTDGSDSAPSVCSTGKTWTNGNHGSDAMHPGGECITCHSQGEGPVFTIAGTVMSATNDDTNCDGVSGATIEITDKNGQTISLTTNSAGNFFYPQNEHGGTSSSIAFPITAKVRTAAGKEKAMATAQQTGECNSCHGATGTNGAPGRIVFPI